MSILGIILSSIIIFLLLAYFLLKSVDKINHSENIRTRLSDFKKYYSADLSFLVDSNNSGILFFLTAFCYVIEIFLIITMIFRLSYSLNFYSDFLSIIIFQVIIFCSAFYLLKTNCLNNLRFNIKEVLPENFRKLLRQNEK